MFTRFKDATLPLLLASVLIAATTVVSADISVIASAGAVKHARFGVSVDFSKNRFKSGSNKTKPVNRKRYQAPSRNVPLRRRSQGIYSRPGSNTNRFRSTPQHGFRRPPVRRYDPRRGRPASRFDRPPSYNRYNGYTRRPYSTPPPLRTQRFRPQRFHQGYNQNRYQGHADNHGQRRFHHRDRQFNSYRRHYSPSRRSQPERRYRYRSVPLRRYGKGKCRGRRCAGRTNARYIKPGRIKPAHIKRVSRCRGRRCQRAAKRHPVMVKPGTRCKGRKCFAHTKPVAPCKGKRCSGNSKPASPNVPCKGRHCLSDNKPPVSTCKGRQCLGEVKPPVLPCIGKRCTGNNKPGNSCKGKNCVADDVKPCVGRHCSGHNTDQKPDPEKPCSGKRKAKGCVAEQPACKGKHCAGHDRPDRPKPCRGRRCGNHQPYFPPVVIWPGNYGYHPDDVRTSYEAPENYTPPQPPAGAPPYRYYTPASSVPAWRHSNYVSRHYLPPAKPALRPAPRSVIPVERYIPKQVVVAMDISGDLNKAHTAILGKGYKLKQSKKYPALNLAFNVYTVPSNTNVKDAVTSLRASHPGFVIDANHLYDLHGDEGVKQKEILRWGKVPQACGKGLKIGLLDTDAESAHQSFNGRKITIKNFLPDNEKPAPKLHATAITSIWLGKDSGLAPSAEVYIASVFRRESEQHVNTSTEWLLSGMSWLVEQKVDVINLSFGGPPNRIFEKAISNVQKKGVIFVASAGNNGPDSPPVFPAAHTDVIAVTAVDSKLKVYNRANKGEYIDFAAPGVNILVAKPGNGKKIVSGTSYAAPYVAAAVAMLRQRNKINYQERFEYLQSTSRDLGRTGKDKEFGWGLIQFRDACLDTASSKTAANGKNRKVILNHKTKVLNASE